MWTKNLRVWEGLVIFVAYTSNNYRLLSLEQAESIAGGNVDSVVVSRTVPESKDERCVDY